MEATNKYKKMIKDIRMVLFNEWDPLNINLNTNLSDEYDLYISPILKILYNEGNLNEIVCFLKKIELEDFGNTNIDMLHLNQIALKLKYVFSSYNS